MRILLSVLFMLLGSNLAMGSGYIRLYGGDTPLIIAARNRHLEAVELLLDMGAVVNQADKWGKTPLWLAARNGRRDVVGLLRSHIWKPRLKNAGIVGLASVALAGASFAGYKYFASEPEAVVEETPEDEIIEAMDANADFIPGEADSSLLLPESDLVLVH